MQAALSSADVVDILKLIEDGFLFERLGQEFLSARLGYKFLAAGGIKDRGIDGLEYASEREDNRKRVFQLSIDKKPGIKIEDTIDKLKKNKIEFTQLTYLTNTIVPNKDEIIDHCLDDLGVALRIWDARWMGDNANHSEATRSLLTYFVKNHLRKYQTPGAGFAVSDYVSDPKLYVYLSQQIGASKAIQNLNQNLMDSLISYSLRDTDPDKGILLSAEEIAQSVRGLINFEIEHLQSKINKRLKILSRKPNRKVKHHRDVDKYCLPYETRLEIVADNARDKALYDHFHEEAKIIIKKNFKAGGVTVRDVATLLDTTLEKIYFKQGLEFADFLLNRGCGDTFQASLSDTVDEILEEKSVVDKNRTKVKDILLESIREIVYHGSPQTKQYLQALSKTYLMLFLLKCDPKIVTFFQTMASNLTVFVCTSILVPAFSEIYLEPQNQRYWSLLKGSKERGVRLVVNDTIISELEFHIKRSKHIYDTEYRDHLNLFSDGIEDLVDQILVRAFIYAKKEGKVSTYERFLDNFLTLGGRNTRQEIIDFLHEEFGIEYVSSDELGVEVDEQDFQELADELSRVKQSEDKAKTDAQLVLSIYAIRRKNGEEKSSVDGYRTWWLSSDTMTHKTVSRLFGNRYPVSCYMRPDFLYNYISFTPSKESVAAVYRSTFPNLLGVQISSHVSPEIAEAIRIIIREHADKLNGRVKAQIRDLVDDLNLDLAS